jgi:hypothetical protein
MASRAAPKTRRTRATGAQVVPEVTRGEQLAAGKEARKRVPRERHAGGSRGPVGRIRSICWRSRPSRACRSSCRSGTGG